DDFERLPVELEPLPHDGGIAAEATHPGLIAEHRDAVGARLILLGPQQPADRRLRTQHGQQTRRDADDTHSLGLTTTARDVFVAADGDLDLLEARRAAPDVKELRRREPVFGDAKTGRS